ncbi:MAG TPA: FlgD immunoglobulin-like domain containing protein [Solirubrobacteraceae bacterium]|nr:FlgD immunoglobulin-like domain containing protein [Solirubrobacteraceae bacterium]
MTRIAQVVFAVLVLAAFGAFFVAQKLKSQPSVVQGFVLRWPVISPNHDGRNDAQRVRFRLKSADVVDVAILNDQGDVVNEIASGLHLSAYRYPKPSLVWDGTTSSGHIAHDGTYRVRITLRGQGRSVVLQDAFRVDLTPPKVRVVAIGPETAPGPELLPRPDGKPARVHLNAPLRRGRLLIFRTAPGPVTLVRTITVAPGAAAVTWNGSDARGRPLEPGTYVAVAEGRDVAGNIGTSVPLGRDGLPVRAYGTRLPGHGGITIRRLGVQPPLLPVAAGRRVPFGVDARRRAYTWTVRRVGGPTIRRGSARRPIVQLKAPAGQSGVYLFQAAVARRVAAVPFAVDDPGSHRVLVVLPLMTWQGRNPVDDDGDGLPNLLSTGQGVKLPRVLATPLPAGFAAREAQTLMWLDRGRHRYDVTTDVALALGTGPKLAGHSGVLLAGDTVWLPPSLQARLRRFVVAGGTLVSMGTGSLERQARLTAFPRLVHPTPPASADLFGSRLAPLRAGSFDLTGAKDQIGLFRGTGGLFRGFHVVEATTSPGPAKLLSSAVTADGHAVIVALRVGRGLVIRFGLPELPARLRSDPDIQGLMERSWQLLSR